MSVLRKKLASEAPLPNSFEDIGILFSDIQDSWAKVFGDTLKTEMSAKGISFSGGNLKTLADGATGLFYALGISEGVSGENCDILLEFSSALAGHCVDAQFGAQEKSDRPATQLDLILMQPNADKVLQELMALEALPKTSQICGRCIGFEALPQTGFEFDVRKKWVRIQFKIAADIEYLINIYCTELMMEKLGVLAHLNITQQIIDPTDPWSTHMRSSVMDTSRMLEVVIEDVNMSIAECTRLELGQIIALPGATHTRLNVNTRSAHGVRVLATSTLGAYKANKAVKLLDDIDPAFFAGFTELESVTN